ncbi:MAG: ferredoxin [Hydrogeniiclostridium sp.]
MKYRVNDGCIGCGFCAETCPEVFRMTEEGVAEALVEENLAAEEAAKEAKESCPAGAIEEK